MNLCIICKKYSNCEIRGKVQLEASRVAEGLLPGAFEVHAVFARCSKFKKDKKTSAAVNHICFDCSHSGTCALWDQVCNIDEDFIKNAFSYDPVVQSVCSTVSYCRKFTPTKKGGQK